jgi:predicted transcriptional regulator
VRQTRRGPGELEAEVLSTLWSAHVPLTAAEVRTRLGRPLSYSTVVTILSRLHTKGALDREHHGRAYAYRPVSDESGLAARRMRQVLDAGSDRHEVLARFVSDLSEEDEQVLLTLLGRRSRPASAHSG